MSDRRFVVGERGLDRWDIKERDGVAPAFTPEQEARLREFIREEIDANRVMCSGLTGDEAVAYAKAIRADRDRWLKTSNPSEAPHAR